MQSVTNVKIISTKICLKVISTEYISIRGKIYLTTTPVAMATCVSLHIIIVYFVASYFYILVLWDIFCRC